MADGFSESPVVLRSSTICVDLVFRRLKLAIEIETDRRRQDLLVLDGWFVLRFTWTMIEEHPEEVIPIVREAIEILTAAQS